MAEKEENGDSAFKSKLHLAELIIFGKCERLNSKTGQKMLNRLFEESGDMYHYKVIISISDIYCVLTRYCFSM